MMFNHGDVILTRNANRSDWNITPGYWNHSAFIVECDDQLCVLEVHFKSPTVMITPFELFKNRYPEWVVLRIKEDNGFDGHAIGEFAVAWIGTPIEYAVARIRTMGRDVGVDNCTSFVRKCVECALDVELPWVIPDDIAGSAQFQIVAKRHQRK